MAAARRVRELVQSGCRYRDITLVCTDMGQYEPLVNLIFSRMHIPIYQSGTEDILQKSMIATVLTALDAALGPVHGRRWRWRPCPRQLPSCGGGTMRSPGM